VVDPSLPIEDAKATVSAATIGAGRTFNAFGRTALLVAAPSLCVGPRPGRIGETTGRASRSGLADPRIKLSVNLRGGRALTAREFCPRAAADDCGRERRRRTVRPVSTDPSKLVNLGANRWSFKPEVGVSHLVRRWTVEGYAGYWFFTTNDEFYRGSSIRTQEPVLTVQGHASYNMKPRMWLAVDATWYSGGTTRVDGVSKADLQRNTRAGITFLASGRTRGSR
jgi:hypothetical protein